MLVALVVSVLSRQLVVVQAVAALADVARLKILMPP